MKKLGTQASCALFILFMIVAMSIFAPALATHNPFEPNIAQRLQGPSLNHFFGTDSLGRDMYSRILFGGRISMLLSLIAAILSLGIGAIVGILCGYYKGLTDTVFTSITAIFQGIPSNCFMIAIAGIMGPDIKSLIFALVITSWSGFSRIVRAEVLQIKEEPFIEGLLCIGCSDWQIITKHILKNLINRLLILFTIRVGRGVLAISGLSFLGLGVQPPYPDWSVMINDAMMFYRSYPHTMLIPGIFIFLLVYSINIIGDELRDKLDIHNKEARSWD